MENDETGNGTQDMLGNRSPRAERGFYPDSNYVDGIAVYRGDSRKLSGIPFAFLDIFPK